MARDVTQQPITQLHIEAERLGMPGRTLEQVTTDLANAKRRSKGKNAGLHIALARIMLRHGRLQPTARAYVEAYYEDNNND